MKVFNMMKFNRYTNIRLVNFQKKAFGANRQFAPYLIQNYVALYLMTHYKDFLKAFYEVHYEARYLHKCKVSHFSKKKYLLAANRQFWTNFHRDLEILGWCRAGSSLTSWGEGSFLALFGHLSSDGVSIKISYWGRS